MKTGAPTQAYATFLPCSFTLQPDWAGDYGCDGNKVWVCGSFQYMWQATYFLQKLKAAYSQTSAIALVGVPDDLFCKANPGVVGNLLH